MDRNNIRIEKLILNNFRNHKFLNLNTNKDLVLICGQNGSGKTNILESISLFDSPSGFKGSSLNEIINSDLKHPIESFGVNALFRFGNQTSKIGFGLKESSYNYQKIISVDGKKSNQRNNEELINIFWIIPKMNFLFLNNSEERRKFIDMMISSVDKSFKKSLKNYEKYKSERLKILKKWGYESSEWLDVVESKMSSIGLVICDARRNFIKELNKNFERIILDFPVLELELTGELDRLLIKKPALEVEEFFLKILKLNRKRDFFTGRTNFGANKTDLLVYEKKNKREARVFSTGQQKVIVFSLFFSFLRYLEINSYKKIIFLLDDIFSYLDQEFIFNVLYRLRDLKVQTWMTDVRGDIISDDKRFNSIIDKINIDDKRFKVGNK
ncbi:MAG: hypothetical protein CMM95_00305 [Rickettsiales bacterium]|nr:hypothetical protein [Rickettsiales bacterium]